MTTPAPRKPPGKKKGIGFFSSAMVFTFIALATGIATDGGITFPTNAHPKKSTKTTSTRVHVSTVTTVVTTTATNTRTTATTEPTREKTRLTPASDTPTPDAPGALPVTDTTQAPPEVDSPVTSEILESETPPPDVQPAGFIAPPPPPPPPPPAPAPAAVENVYYRNCAAARAAGAAPLYVGEPGYRLKLDRDRDGIACE